MARNEKQYREYKALMEEYTKRFDLPPEANPFEMNFGYSQRENFEEEIKFLKIALKEGKELQEIEDWAESFYEGLIK